jgi:hypothetical protein
MARIFIIWGGRGYSAHFKPGSRIINSQSLTLFLDTAARYSRQIQLNDTT